jgi:hypothetical protein
MEILDYLRDRLSGFSIEGSIDLLKCLGGCEWDQVTVLTTEGYQAVPAKELPLIFNGLVPVDRLRPVYFWGGPIGARQFKGNYLTFLVDRVMYRMCEKGWAHVNATILYCEGLAIGRKAQI